MLAKFIEDEVTYCSIKYEKLLHKAETEFILGLMENLSPEEFTEIIEELFYHIDHGFMEKGIDEIKTKIMEIDSTIDLQTLLPDKYETVPLTNFKTQEIKYGKKLIKQYELKFSNLKNNHYDLEKYLTQQIKSYRKMEKFIPYYHKDGTIASMRTLADYNSMLYNVNLTKSGWNQSMKDAQILGRDLLILNGHPNSCPDCLAHQGKIYSLSGNGYPSVEEAEAGGVGHPNCKCEWSIYWNEEQKEQTLSTDENYQEHTKLVAIDRELRYARLEKKLYEIIGNVEMADRTKQKIQKLRKSKNEL